MGLKARLGAFFGALAIGFTAVKGAHDYNKYIKNKDLTPGEINPPAVEDVIDPAIKDTEDVKDQIDNSTIEEATKDKLTRLLGLIEGGLTTAQAQLDDASYAEAQTSVYSTLNVVEEIKGVINTKQHEIENLEELNASISSLETSLRKIYLLSATQVSATKYQAVVVTELKEEATNSYQTIISPEGNAVYDGSSIGIIEDGFVYLKGGEISRGKVNLFGSVVEKLVKSTTISINENGNYVVTADLGEGKTETLTFGIQESGEISGLTMSTNDVVNYEMSFTSSSLTDYTVKRDELAKTLTNYTGLKTVLASIESSYKEDEAVKIEQTILMDNEEVCKILHVQNKKFNLFVEGITYSKDDKTEYIEQKEGVVTYLGRDAKGNVVLESKQEENLEVDYCGKMLGMVGNYFSDVTKLVYNEAENSYEVYVNNEGGEIKFSIRLDSYGRIKRIEYTKGVETQVYNFKEISRAEFDRLYSKLSAEMEQMRTEYNSGSSL